jgi:hypothetical protein
MKRERDLRRADEYERRDGEMEWQLTIPPPQPPNMTPVSKPNPNQQRGTWQKMPRPSPAKQG